MLSWILWTACTSPEPSPGASGVPLAFEGDRVPTNLLVISLDTTRRDRLGQLAGLDTAPFLDGLASEGVLLADHRSCSNWTAPSMICATTGRTPLDLGFWPNSGDASVDGVPDTLPSLARALSEEGWRTQLVTANPIFSDQFGAGDGFDDAIVLDFADADAVLDRALPVAARLIGESPWYLHLHLFDPHRPYCPPPAYRGALDALDPLGFDVCASLPEAIEALQVRDEAYRALLLQHVDALYRAEIRRMDDALAELFDALGSMSLLEDVLVVWLTDHGEQLLERGQIDHGFALHAEENRAAAGLWARTLRPGRWEGPTLHQDLAATLFDLYEIAPETPLSGIPLGHAPVDRGVAVMAYSRVDAGSVQVSVIQGDRQLHTDWDGTHQLFELDVDPLEASDVYTRDHPDAGALWSALGPLLGQIEATWPHLGPAPAP